MLENDGRTEIERKLEAESRAKAEGELVAAPAEPVATPTPQERFSSPVAYGAQPMTEQTGEAPQVYTAPLGGTPPIPMRRKSTLERWREKGGFLGTIATALIFLAKVGAPLFALLLKVKFLFLPLISMAASIWAYSTIFGLPFAVGIVALLFIHECGHATAGLLRGIKPSTMVFIPFMGAVVTLRGHGKSLEQDAFIGIMGPVFGTLAGVGCLLLGLVTGKPIFFALAYFNFFMNLFNLIPTAPLDGGWIAPLFSPKLLAVGVVLMLYVGRFNPMIWLLGLMSLPRIIGGWKANPATQPYYRVSAAAKLKYGLIYVGLAAFLAIAMSLCKKAIGDAG